MAINILLPVTLHHARPPSPGPLYTRSLKRSPHHVELLLPEVSPSCLSVSPMASNRDGPGRASSRLPLERCDSARARGGALPVIMSIIRSSRNPRLPQLQPLSARYNLIKKITKKSQHSTKGGFWYRFAAKSPPRGSNVAGTPIPYRRAVWEGLRAVVYWT